MIIAIAHQKGGVGKSTVCWHLAFSLKVDAVVDLDYQQSITSFNQIRQASGKKPLTILTPSRKELQAIIDNDNDDQVLLIDLGGFDSNINRIVIASADVVITPFIDKPTELLGLRKFRKILDDIESNVGEAIDVHVLINRVHHSRKHYAEIDQVISHLGFNVMKTRIVDHAVISESVGDGLTLNEVIADKKHRALKDFNLLAKETQLLLTAQQEET